MTPPADGARYSGGRPKPRAWLALAEASGRPARGSSSPTTFKSYLGRHNLPLNAATAEDGEAAFGGALPPAASHFAGMMGSQQPLRRAGTPGTMGLDARLELYSEPVSNATWDDTQFELERQRFEQGKRATEQRIRMLFDGSSQASPP